MRTRKLRTLAAAIVVALAPAAYAATPATSIVDDPVQQLNTAAENRGQTHVATKIASSFGDIAGSDANTLKLVQALRTGAAVKLTTASAGTGTGTGTTTTTTITPPTGKMGWGNVFTSLALAKDSLTRAGITNPTTAQLQAALTGGDVTGADGKTVAMKGILQLRADGMGWGQIAKAQGTKLGPVVSSIKSAHTKVAALPAPSGTPTTATTTAAGTMKTSKAVTTAPKGLVTAGGTTAASGVTHGNSGHGGGGKGVVNASGGSQGKGSNAGGSGHGKGKGGG